MVRVLTAHQRIALASAFSPCSIRELWDVSYVYCHIVREGLPAITLRAPDFLNGVFVAFTSSDDTTKWSEPGLVELSSEVDGADLVALRLALGRVFSLRSVRLVDGALERLVC